MEQTSYSRPEGCNDYNVEETANRKALEATLLGLFQRYGYGQITLPTVEYSDLYSPQRIGSNLFYRLMSARISESQQFPTAEVEGPPEEEPGQGHLISEVVLRPEFTAPVARWFVSRWLAEDKPLPLPERVAYAGQVFRDVDPAPEHRKEFRQVGVELIGADPRWGDLEVLCMACDAARELKLPDWKLHLGNAHLYREILRAHGLTDEVLFRVAGNLEIAAGIALTAKVETDDQIFFRYVREFLETHRSRFPADDPDVKHPERLSATSWRTKLPDLHDRYLRDLWGESGLSRKTITELLDLARLTEDAPAFFTQLERFTTNPETQELADDLRGLCEELEESNGVTPFLTSAASRGLAYYTGLTFEIHCPVGTSPHTNICGGGRYDRLHVWVGRRIRETQELRGQLTPDAAAGSLNGVGFAFNLDRVEHALAGAGREPAPRVEVFVAVIDDALAAEGFRFADRLRRHRPGIATWCNLPASDVGRGEEADADRLGARFTVRFGPGEQVGLRDRRTDREVALTSEAAYNEITAALDGSAS
jgi:histidyl-tRNA synthetase